MKNDFVAKKVTVSKLLFSTVSLHTMITRNLWRPKTLYRVWKLSSALAKQKGRTKGTHGVLKALANEN